MYFHNDALHTGVHDSFWTHAGSVEILSKLLRQTFVQLHSRPLLRQLESELGAQIKDGGAGSTMEKAVFDANAEAAERKASDKTKVVKKSTKKKLNLELPPMPPTGDLNLEEIYKAPYFFS